MTQKSIDIKSVRQDTPSCVDVIHFNNAGAGLMPDPVFEAVTDHLSLERRIGGYEAQDEAKPLLDSFYTGFAELLNADASEIAYVENATRAWDMAFYSIPLSEGDRVITHESEYVSSYLAFLQLKKRKGIEIDVVPSDESGQIDVDKLTRLITSKTKVIALTHIPTQGGLVNPVAEVGRIAKEHGLIYLLDACQSAGQLKLDVSEIKCDLLSGTGRKFLRGPRGTGFLYVSSAILPELDPLFIDLHSATWLDENTYEFEPGAKRFENWESNIAGRVGLATAVEYALDIGLPQIETRVKALGNRLREQLAEQGEVTVQDRGTEKCGIVTFTKDGENPSDLAERLRSQNINISVSVRSSAQLDFGPRNLDSVARASVHYYNTEDEIDQFCAVVAKNK